MKTLFGSLAVLTVAAGTLFVAGCGGGDKRLNAGGSSFIYPLMSKWAAEYKTAKGVEVNYQSIGSGGGIEQMTARILDFGCTDAPMNEERLKAARETGSEPLHIPLVLGAVVPTYNLEEVKEPLRFTGPVLAEIYLGKIKKWNDKAIRDLNTNADLPDAEIVVVHRSDGSGSTFIWAQYLSKVYPAWRDKVGVGTSLNWPVGIGQKGSEGVAGQVRRSARSIGYVELEYALQNKMSIGLVQNQEKEFIKPTLQSVTAAAASLKEEDIPDNLCYSLIDAPGKESYPISGTTWAVVYDKLPAGKGQLVVDFLRWVTHEGQEYCEGLNYSRLPKVLVGKLEKKLDQIKVGQ
jgi:phosphate transport system substrate-binding protein